MPRFQMDDTLYDDPAVIRAGTAAFGLYARCGDYVARQLLDGFVPSEVAAQWGTPEWVRKLTDADLWETVPGGFHMPRYLADNPSREKVLAERALKAERQRKWLENKKKSSSTQRRTNRPSRDASQDAPLTTPSTPPLPPSLTGRKWAAPPPAASARPDSKTVTEALRNGIEPGHRASPAAYEHGPELARRLLAEKRSGDPP